MHDQLRRRLEAIDDRLGSVALPAGLEERISRSVHHRGPSPWVFALAATALVVVAFVLGRRTVATPTGVTPPVAAPAVTRVDAVPIPIAVETYVDDGCPRELGVRPAWVPAGCRLTLHEPAMTLEVYDATRLQTRSRGVRVLEGNVGFSVQEVATGDPHVVVEVGAGTIEVLGTHFVVRQGERGGHVDLLDGAIAFVDRQAATHVVTPGRRLSWEAERVLEAPAAAKSSASPAEHRPSATSVDDELDATLEEVAALRRAGDYRAAVKRLGRLRARIHDATKAEILSYEEGTLRAYYAPAAAMCAYWRGHLARFGDGAYASSVRAALKRGACDG